MTFSKHDITAVVDVGVGVSLSVIDARITLDDGWSPYIQVQLTCFTPADDDLELLDPRDQPRVTLTVTKEFADWNPGALVDQVRTFDLLLRERKVDHTSGTMLVVLESDEALLQDFALVAITSERAYGLSVKTAVEYALNKVGAVLEAGAADADIENQVDEPVVTNYFTNPSFETSTTGWGSGYSPTSSTAQALFGSRSLRIVVPSPGGSGYGSPSEKFAVTPSTEYVFSLYIRAASTPVDTALLVRWFTAADATISTHISPTRAISAAEWTRLDYKITSPPTATKAFMGTNWPGAVSSGQVFYIDGVMVTKGPDLIDYFDGSTPDPGLIGYAWTGTANASPSTRTYLPNSDAMIWQPGLTAWDFLEPILQATALRLYCDENRDWILELSGTAREGQINLSAEQNVTKATDQITRNENWYDSVVVAYTRTLDAEGKETTVYDIAGAPGTKTLSVEYDRAYPGPGAAQALLDRALGRGRILDLESISDYTTTPGMALSATLPDSPIQTGTISNVSWSFPSSRMTIGSRGLTDTPATAWLFAPAGVAWEDITPGIDWTEYTP